MTTADWPRRAAVFGATGGIGAALCRALADRNVAVMAGSRSGECPRHQLITPFRFDLSDEDSIRTAARSMADEPPELVIVATGLLTLADGTGPERSYKALDPAAMAEAFAANAIGPALVAKHLLPLMPRQDRFVFAAISAKVGSISDNRMGGWHSYRASKAALNMLVKNFAIEMARTHEQSIVVALHPGTVDTQLSQPFQSNLPEGQLTPRREAAMNLLQVLLQLRPDDSGKLIAWDGAEIAP
ncbi:SDR family NAD(P)-dependent oxidoreductase [Alteraurantiacibacter aquimixticola]|uniref:SDR family NAD(P)-dependent oxidoreductase n=1 Tax=Alteraurantiacibacter aquimixticola TaxID=2489173 RepID=A0A4T3F389_9SPHN|nr:SDR family NAD(P)-dependent oxidoreductase [Alteraurantiacibacter aquimixticola]TIX49968.1 SDR family NAD(P)-dependent oxidoreductase [Alteraurantiacibacter aquimixticola]